jgi:cytochrome c oxidase subunit III
MKNKASYYVPEQSAWPIIGALALLFLAFGSLNLEQKWGVIAFMIGLVGLVFMLGGWFWNVTQESNAGLYNQQMDKTFRWGMCWFLVSEFFLFALLIGSIIHVRFSIAPWLAGQSGDASQLTHYLIWPDFAKHWPLLKPPSATTAANTFSLSSLHQIPLINLIILIASALFLTTARYQKKSMGHKSCRLSLNLAIFLAFIFLISQTYYLIQLINAHIITQSGVYGSFLIAFLGLHSLNSVGALLLMGIVCFRIYRNQLLEKNSFSFDATVWWWDFLAAIWLLGFFLVF